MKNTKPTKFKMEFSWKNETLFKGHLSSMITFTCFCGWLANTCFAVIEFFQSICTLIYVEKNWISFCNFRLEQQELQKAPHLMLLPPILLKLLVQRLTRLTNAHCTGHRLGQELCPLLVTPQTLWRRSTFRPNTCPTSGSWEESPCCVS